MKNEKQVSDEYVEKTIGSVMNLMAKLNAVMKDEKASLDRMDRQKFLDLQLEKVTLAQSYEMEAQKLLALRGKIGRADEALKKELKESYREFSDEADENLKVLKQRKDGVQKLNTRIVDAARKILVQKDEKYDASGKVGGHRTNQSLSSGLMDTV